MLKYMRETRSKAQQLVDKQFILSASPMRIQRSDEEEITPPRTIYENMTHRETLLIAPNIGLPESVCGFNDHKALILP